MKQKVNLRTIINNIGIKSIVAFSVVFLLIVAATCAGGYQLYHYTKESIVLQGEVNAVRAAKEFDSYLLVRKNTVILAGRVLDDMIAEGRSIDKVMDFLLAESKSLKKTVDPDCTGLYGWIMGQYCDGEGWVPDEDYIPTERPWYQETIADDSDVTFVKPYLDAQTGSIMTTMATALSDEESVLAFDVSLERVQQITEKIAKQTPGSYGIVLDKDGQVIAHSNSKELGKNYLEEDGTIGASLADTVINAEEDQFEFSFKNQIYLAYVEKIEGGWSVISMVNTKMFYRPLMLILTLLFLFTMLEAAILFAIFYNQSSKNIAISRQNVQLAAVADMYISIFDIDIPFDSIHRIRRGRDTDLTHFIGGNQKSAQSSLNEMFDKGVHELSKPLMDPFINIATLPERLQDTETITEEFLDSRKHWCRGRFIVAERDKDGTVIRVLWMVESIDEEKKRRDNLKALSETDRMTGIFNRAGGESKITELIGQENGGMFIMMDVDVFKHFNDQYGHDVGDKVIIATARALVAAVRGSDVVMRLGGDEFVAYAPGVLNEETGMHIVDRIFEMMNRVKIEELKNDPVCVSAGVAFCPEGEIVSFTELYKKADICVYESKKKSGNTVTFYHFKDTDDVPDAE